MGITCEIGIYKPEDGAFRPGDVIAGVIKYGFDKDTAFSEITVSLKGFGKVHIAEQRTRHAGKRTTTETVNYVCSEEYVDLDYVITNNNMKENLYFQKGMYESQFNFKLPVDVPPSLNFIRHRGTDSIKCFIVYYVRIKFDRPGFLKFTKRYKQVVTVLSGVRPTLPMTPTICSEKKVLSKIFACKERVINIKATIDNCVISSGGKIKFNCEVSNFTNVTIKAIHPRLVELYTFSIARKVSQSILKMHEEKVEDTSSKTGVLRSGQTQDFEFEINVPTDKTSIENAKIVSRKYFVVIKVVLPVPHRNAFLKIPVQIGDTIREDGLIREIFEYNLDAPPTYWEAMTEAQDDDEIDKKDMKADEW